MPLTLVVRRMPPLITLVVRIPHFQTAKKISDVIVLALPSGVSPIAIQAPSDGDVKEPWLKNGCSKHSQLYNRNESSLTKYRTKHFILLLV